MLFIIIALLFPPVQLVCIRTTNFSFKKNEPVKLSYHIYLRRTNCKTAIRCAAACLTSPGCVLADLDSGNLYKNAQAQGLESQLVINRVEFQENKFDEQGPEAKHDEFLLMDSGQNGLTRNVYKVSLKLNTTKKTGVTVTSKVQSIVYDRSSNTLFWSQENGIFKQVLKSFSKKTKSCSGKNIAYLNIYNKKLVYCMNLHGNGIINTHDPVKRNNKNLWLSVNKTHLCKLVIDGNIGCWIERSKGFSINCYEMSSKQKIYKLPQPHLYKGASQLALLKTPSYGMLVFTEKDKEAIYFIKVVEIFSDGKFAEPRTVTSVVGSRWLKIAPGYLIYSILWSNKVEIWEISQNGSVGRMAFSTRYPSSSDELTLLVALV